VRRFNQRQILFLGVRITEKHPLVEHQTKHSPASIASADVERHLPTLNVVEVDIRDQERGLVEASS
jgi:hypothetical protein